MKAQKTTNTTTNQPKRLPKVLVSSVIRSSQEGESHGGIYIVDLETEKFKQVIDWNDATISWEGRGGDRGLRGIAFYKETIYMAASDELFCFDSQFKIKASYKNDYLKHAHEIFIEEDRLYISSTGFDTILIFDLLNKKFIEAFCFRRKERSWKDRLVSKGVKVLHRELPLNNKYHFFRFDPSKKDGPQKADTVHLNNVFVKNQTIYFSGTGLNHLMAFHQNSFRALAPLPGGTHNVQFYQDHILFNDTKHDRVTLQKKESSIHWNIPFYQKETLSNPDISEDRARQAFGRGLCTLGDWIIGGSSPATITVYDNENANPIKVVQLSKDIRNAIHGLEVWAN